MIYCIGVMNLAGVPGVRLVRPDPDVESIQKDYSFINMGSHSESTSYGHTMMFPPGTAKHWLVRMERPAIGGIRKPQMVDYYVQVLMRVLRK